jgi:hypothetical protein
MQKTTTHSKTRNHHLLSSDEIFQPSEKTLNNILRFAAVYRAQQLPDNNYVNYFLN